MANRKVTINIDTTANVTGAKQAAAAMNNLATSSNKVSVAGQAAGKGASRVGQLAGQAGFQIQDFAVQVGAGTSALTAFSQQAPQLLGAFGPAGAIAGAIVAVGAIAAKVFMTMGDDAESASKKAENLTTKLEKIREAADKAIKDEIDFGKQKIEDATTAAGLLANELNNVATNQLSLNRAILESLDDVNEAEMILEELRGENNDKLKLQDEQAAAAASRRQAEIAQQIDEEKIKVKIAEDALFIAREDLAEKEKAKAEGAALLNSEFKLVEAARERLRILKETAKETTTATTTLPMMGGGLTIAKTPAAQAAKAELASGSTLGEIERLKVRVKQIAESISNTGKLTVQVEDAERDVLALESDLRVTIDDVNTAINSIDIESQGEEVKQTAEMLAERAALLGEDVKAITEGVTANNAIEKAALAVIKKNLDEGGITLDEIQSTSSALSALAAPIRDAIDGNTQKISQLITIMNNFQTQSNQLQKRIDAIQKTQGTRLPSN